MPAPGADTAWTESRSEKGRARRPAPTSVIVDRGFAALPDVGRSALGFAEWCDYVARDQCVRYRNDTILIGYFYSDCPVWVHTRKDNEWRGALFDAKELRTESGRRELLRIATH